MYFTLQPSTYVSLWLLRAPLVAQPVKNLAAMWETWIWSLGQIPSQSLDYEDPLEKGMTTHSSILAWRIPWTGIQSRGSQRIGYNWAAFTFTLHISFQRNSVHCCCFVQTQKQWKDSLRLLHLWIDIYRNTDYLLKVRVLEAQETGLNEGQFMLPVLRSLKKLET